MAQTTERAFESYVEIILRDRAGWHAGTNAEWDVERAPFPARVVAFLQGTQPKLWAEMQELHGAGLERLLIDTLVKELDLKGAPHSRRLLPARSEKAAPPMPAAAEAARDVGHR